MTSRKPVAIFDIDGTIFRSSLLIELFLELVERKVFSKRALLSIEKLEVKWLNREGGYDDYVKEVVKVYKKEIVRKKKKDVVAAGRSVIKEQKFHTYRYTHNLIRRLRKNYFTVAISGSPLEVVGEYNKVLKFDKLYGTEFGIDEQGKYTGAVLHEPPMYKKEVIVRFIKSHNLSFKGSVGIGDTESDIGYLELVEKPVAFNPNVELARHAKKRGWPVVIERKDFVVEFKPRQVKYLTV